MLSLYAKTKRRAEQMSQLPVVRDKHVGVLGDPKFPKSRHLLQHVISCPGGLGHRAGSTLLSLRIWWDFRLSLEPTRVRFSLGSWLRKNQQTPVRARRKCCRLPDPPVSSFLCSTPSGTQIRVRKSGGKGGSGAGKYGNRIQSHCSFLHVNNPGEARGFNFE